MEDVELLEAIKHMIEKTEITLRSEMQEGQRKLEEKLQAVKPDIMNGVSILLDTEFKRNFGLLQDRLDEIAVKMPSEDDMDIIDGRLAEHDDELKVVRQDVATLRQDVDKLKKAQ